MTKVRPPGTLKMAAASSQSSTPGWSISIRCPVVNSIVNGLNGRTAIKGSMAASKCSAVISFPFVPTRCLIAKVKSILPRLVGVRKRFLVAVQAMGGTDAVHFLHHRFDDAGVGRDVADFDAEGPQI